MSKFFGYDAKFKNLFFDRQKVRGLMEKSKFRILSNFGWSVREVVRKKLGPPSKTKPRAPGKSPRTRTNEKGTRYDHSC